ncbi:MAG TPA: DUF6587 family protein [Steroidobacteraceae bacterium]|nr:DUF6587 family protein [Steroidobacteraceae bacterium]
MSRWIDVLAVGIAVALSILYALSALGPKTLRARLWRVLGLLLASAPRPLRSARLEARVAATAARMQAACGGCDSCVAGASAAGASAAGASAGASANGSSGASASGVREVRVPLARIGRLDSERIEKTGRAKEPAR